MKKSILLTLLFLLPLSIQADEFKVDERKSDIYFANSVLTTKPEAIADLILIRKNIKLEQYQGNNIKMKKELNFNTAYNHTYGFTDDIEETIMQLADDSLNWKLFSDTIAILIKRSAGKAIKVISGSEKANELSKRVFEATQISLASILEKRHDIDLTTQILKYQNSIRQGHSVIVIGHGQGDLFVNEASQKMLEPSSFEGTPYRDNSWLGEYFSWISVGTPSNARPDAHPQVAFDNDIMTTFNMSDKILNPNRYGFKNALDETVNELTIEFHNFKYYIGSPIHIKDGLKDQNVLTDLAKSTIMTFLKGTIEKHRTYASQWAIDQEFDENTKNYKITIKHIYNDQPLINLMKDIKIYPFSGAKKLYQLDSGEWVKASFGGEKISDTWDGQDEETQFYKLEGTNPAEYIEGAKKDICQEMPYKADRFMIEAYLNIEEGNREFVYYSNNPQEMGAMLDFRITTVDDEGYIFADLDNGCYPDDINVTITFDTQGETNLNSNIQYKDSNVSLKPFDPLKPIDNKYTLELKKTDFIDGSTIKSIKFNFDRASNKAKNPMKLTIKDINASLGTVIGGDSIDKSATFIYARANGVDHGFARGYSSVGAKVYYEVHCNHECNKADFGINGAESETSPYWYIVDNDYNLDYSSPYALYNGITVSKANNDYIQLTLTKSPPHNNRIYFTPKDYLLFDKYNANVKTHSFLVIFQ